ncbi:unnamed protein product [Mytilus edulis]|uniref:Fungal lipase-type domain-containing protein n=1 Tax=Mytilus edulis TaxID=6550 RepID=A0A8S3T2U5_MYTED|nr:unnamed protein product [Mytilus edulis]
MNDFEIVEWIGRHCEDLSLLAYRECVATVMISHKRKVIVLAYQGTTEFKQYLDEMQSVLFSSKVSGGIGNGEVQEYFKEAHDRIFPCVITSLKEQISSYPNYNILITGHSLGGVIASIASASLIYHHIIKDEKISLYTFGMPKVGNSQYALEHNILVKTVGELSIVMILYHIILQALGYLMDHYITKLKSTIHLDVCCLRTENTSFVLVPIMMTVVVISNSSEILKTIKGILANHL